jgi:hypothetical protein
MRNYKAMKAAGKWSVRKQKVVDSPAVSEIKDGDTVVRAAEAERSHNELQLVQKSYNASTGEAQADSVRSYSLSEVANERSRLAADIKRMQDEDKDWAQMEKDLKAL